MTQPPTIALIDEVSALQPILRKGLREFNKTLFAGHPPGRDLAIAIRDPERDEPVGGLCGRMNGGWLAIELIFVPEALRGLGLATRLIAMAEDEARNQGCHSAWIDTLNPKALVLYRRLGYEVFGELKDYPIGGSRFFLQKKLGPVG
ncbi:GNAT family N-acetyltransferase [Microvirga lotononidis]|uniref:Putative acyltransferase n=1 Tax=Microvirga lotononidis TaxID=864069 RepID=I4YT01_9HYPH|nr:GNAT family N-acetyltransferase [Microvirga lotononidis]EIM27093.1 putative acyltransferase [Microvirga lotononidis]WQO28718.1 GNAT family N-acetyltransferase [Microvirga lotononidis]